MIVVCLQKYINISQVKSWQAAHKIAFWRMHFKLLLVYATCFELMRDTETISISHGDGETILQYRPGDILLAGLMRVHRRGNETCSEIQDDGIQAVETMNMIIDQINKNTTILPGVRLGTVMVDTCDVDSHALQRVVIDILPLIWNVTMRSPNTSSDRPTIPLTLMAGVVGAASSAVSIQVANLLQVFDIPQVSYWSTSPDLSNKDRFGFFFRVVPSDTNQASAMIAFVKQQKWNFIAVVYEDDFYGVRGFTEIKDIAEEQGVCIATELPVPRSPTKRDFENIVFKLLKTPAKAVVVFTKRNDAIDLMLTAQEIGKGSEDFIWIGSDGWSRQIPLDHETRLKDEIMDGSIGFTPKRGYLIDLPDYFTSITLDENRGAGNFRNPWFAEYISQANGCSLETAVPGGKRQCAGNETVKVSNFEPLLKMESVANSVLAFVYALDMYRRDKCGETEGLCKEVTKMTGTNLLARELFDYMKDMQFKGVKSILNGDRGSGVLKISGYSDTNRSCINGDTVQFDENLDGPAVFNIFNYQAKKNVSPGKKLQKWVHAGTYDDGSITWTEELSEKVNETDSVCSKPCKQGQAKITGTMTCCWHCQTCRKDEYLSENATTCSTCQIGAKPSYDKSTCLFLPITEMAYNSGYGIACVCVGSFGLLLTALVAVLYTAYRDTAIIRASGRELCFFVILGAFITYLNFLSMAAHPTLVSCVVSRILLAIGPTFMYAGMLTKTVRIVIIFQSKAIISERVKLFIRPWPQVLCTLAVVLIQVIILAIWFAVQPPGVDVLYPTSDVAFQACVRLMDVSVLIGLVYPFLLIIVCTVLATINRNVPTGFNETQYIGFSMYTTCVIWLAFLPIFITNSTDLPQRIMTTSLCLSLSATTVLVCLFGSRCYTIIFHPEVNTQKSVMSTNVDKGGRPGSLANVSSTQARSRRTEHSSSNTNNNNIHRTRKEKARRSRNPTSFLRKKSFDGYCNGAMSVTSTELSISARVEKQYFPPPEHLNRETTSVEDMPF